MPARRYSTLVTTNVPITTTNETIVATITGVTTPRPGVKVQLFGLVQVTTGGSTTALTLRWRRGSTITDTVVGEGNPTQVDAVAGSTSDETLAVEDTPGEVASQTYVLTVQQTAAAADGSALLVEAWADVDF